MLGDPDPRYVRARVKLLDAMGALRPHHEALTLVGAQAVYLRTGPGDLVVTPFTEDGDLAVNPPLLAPEPLLESAMAAAGFNGSDQPGSWVSAEGVVVDLLVPSSLAGPGNTRGARIPPHGRRVARRTRGLEAALVDRTVELIGALDRTDPRSHLIGVAGPSALIVAKVHKLGERIADAPHRLVAKDALDVYRLLIAYDAVQLAEDLTRLRSDPRSAEATEQAIVHLGILFDEDRPMGAVLAAEALATFQDSDEVISASVGLVRRLLGALKC